MIAAVLFMGPLALHAGADMARNWMINRDDAELLVDILEQYASGRSLDMAFEVRELFGMCNQPEIALVHSNNGFGEKLNDLSGR